VGKLSLHCDAEQTPPRDVIESPVKRLSFAGNGYPRPATRRAGDKIGSWRNTP